MSYEHTEPPVAVVHMGAYKYPVEIAKQMLVAGWNNHDSQVMTLLSALNIYRDCVYGSHGDYPSQWCTTESVLNFVHRHPQSRDMEYHSPKVDQLAKQLLDHIRFFQHLEDCVGAGE